MLIITVIAAWAAVLLVVATLAVAAARGDEALELALAEERRELPSAIVLSAWTGAPLVSSQGTLRSPAAERPAAARRA
jgi:hypothetical protein